MNVRLYIAQRVTAAILAPLVLIHIATMLYAIKGGLTAAEILGRTRGSIAWFAFYEIFVIAAAIHAAIGLRTILMEWFGLTGSALDWIARMFGALLLIAGTRAVFAVVIG